MSQVYILGKPNKTMLNVAEISNHCNDGHRKPGLRQHSLSIFITLIKPSIRNDTDF